MLACLCGLVWQLLMVSDLYFKYKVDSVIEIAIPTWIIPLATTLCTRWTDVLDYERLNQETARDWSKPREVTDIQKYQHELPVREIFRFTPEERESLARVSVRIDDSYDRIDVIGSDAYNRFSVRKFIYLENICYQFHPLNMTVRSYTFYAMTIRSAAMLYDLWLNATLTSAENILVIMHEGRVMPFISLKYHPTIKRRISMDDPSYTYNHFKSHLIRLSIRKLPSPYESNCHDYSPAYSSHVHCAQDCVIRKTLKRFNRLPFSDIITDQESAQKMISVIDLKNSSLVKDLLTIEQECSQGSCRKEECVMKLSMTVTESYVSKSFWFRLRVPSQPWFTVISRAKLDLVEYLTYVMSTVSTWTGMSVMSMLPTTIVKSVRRMIRRFHLKVARKRSMRSP